MARPGPSAHDADCRYRQCHPGRDSEARAPKADRHAMQQEQHVDKRREDKQVNTTDDNQYDGNESQVRRPFGPIGLSAMHIRPIPVSHAAPDWSPRLDEVSRFSSRAHGCVECRPASGSHVSSMRTHPIGRYQRQPLNNARVFCGAIGDLRRLEDYEEPKKNPRTGRGLRVASRRVGTGRFMRASRVVHALTASNASSVNHSDPARSCSSRLPPPPPRSTTMKSLTPPSAINGWCQTPFA
ncbi:hypothetical protein BTRA_2034 [Burkholderia thailandensis USAMRU Malaysia |nr:hypothetical protein BTQ_1841 [Burkholderia thailandensis 2002721723]AHI79401.1 hypothetical protein BTJ_514 [Burkholderia thailandensis E444]AIC86096.1 hypothetical protein BTRA_2034 [Burkholderia thailandensis USAMRU Malaysia \